MRRLKKIVCVKNCLWEVSKPVMKTKTSSQEPTFPKKIFFLHITFFEKKNISFWLFSMLLSCSRTTKSKIAVFLQFSNLKFKKKQSWRSLKNYAIENEMRSEFSEKKANNNENLQQALMSSEDLHLNKCKTVSQA